MGDAINIVSIKTRSGMPRVEKHVPMPPSRRLIDRFPLMDLEPGDSFLVGPDLDTQNSNIYRAARHIGIRIRIRQTSLGQRVWRVK